MRTPKPRPRAPGTTYMRLPSPTPSSWRRTPPDATASPSSSITRKLPPGSTYSDGTVSIRHGSRTTVRSYTSIAYAWRSSAASGSSVPTRRSSTSPASALAMVALAGVAHAAADLDGLVGPRARVEDRALPLVDLDRAPELRAQAQRGG